VPFIIPWTNARSFRYERSQNPKFDFSREREYSPAKFVFEGENMVSRELVCYHADKGHTGGPTISASTLEVKRKESVAVLIRAGYACTDGGKESQVMFENQRRRVEDIVRHQVDDTVLRYDLELWMALPYDTANAYAQGVRERIARAEMSNIALPLELQGAHSFPYPLTMRRVREYLRRK
jgi:hypothetical protein